MTRVSRIKLRQDRLQAINEHFLNLIATLHSSKEIRNFLDSFLTKEEKIMLAKRFVLIMMLERGYSPSTIQDALHISYETVRSHNIRHSTQNILFKKTIRRLTGNPKVEEFWRKLDKILTPLGLMLESGTNMKARAKLYSGDWD